MNLLIAAIILVPMLGATLLWTPTFRKVPAGFSIIVAGITALMVARVGVNVGATPVSTWWEVVPGLSLGFRVDFAGWLFAILAAVLWVPATAYARSYISRHPHKTKRFFTFYTLSLAATMGIAFAGNFFTLYLFYELLTFVTWPLVIHNETPAAKRAGRVYLVYSLGGAALVLAAMLVTWWVSGTIEFAPGGVLPQDISPGTIRILILLLVGGFGVKAAVMPIHSWLPSAMEAPTPVSALLHAVAVVNAGCFGLLRTFYSVVGFDSLERAALGTALLVLASITILMGSLFALRQDQLKKRLAYSTVSQLGYITLGIFSGHGAILLAGILHFVNHAVMKITLFFCAGAIISETGLTNISQLRGIGRRMPIVMGAFSVAAMGMVGVIPINGFVSKWFMFQGALEAGRPEIIVVLLGSALLNAFYFFPIIGAAFFHGTEPWQRERLSSGLVWPPVLTAVASLVLGILPWVLYPTISQTVQTLVK